MAEIKINMNSLKTYRKAVRHKVKDGSNIYRFTPPFGENCEGYPYAFWAISWGLSDPESGNRRPYADCKQTDGKSPIWEYLDLLRAKVEGIKIEMMSEGKTEEEIKERLKPTNVFISNLRPKTVFAWNAIDKAGTVGILELKSTAHKQVLKLMNSYIMDYNQDPTSLGKDPADSGVWFNVMRTGMNFDTEYSVKKNQIMTKDATTGVPSYQDDRSEIPDSVATDYDNQGYDLTTIYQKKSYDELRAILETNLKFLVETNPDLYVEDFCSGIATASTQEAPAQNAPQGAGTVGLKLGSVETQEAMPQSTQTNIPENIEATIPESMKATPVQSDDADAMMKMAEDIFNS